MFNNKAEEEADFCEAYKSQILNVNTEEKSSSVSSVVNIATILILLAIIIAASIYGYNYFMSQGEKVGVMTPPISVQTIEDDDLKVTMEEPSESVENDIDKIANDVKIEISKSEANSSTTVTDAKKEVETLKVPTTDEQSAYIEELAKLTEEIDKDRK